VKKFAPIVLATTILAGGLFAQPLTSEASGYDVDSCESAKLRVEHLTDDIETIQNSIDYILGTKSTRDDELNLPAKYNLLEDKQIALEDAKKDVEIYCEKDTPFWGWFTDIIMTIFKVGGSWDLQKEAVEPIVSDGPSEIEKVWNGEDSDLVDPAILK
jgi:hypothetical protein